MLVITDVNSLFVDVSDILNNATVKVLSTRTTASLIDVDAGMSHETGHHGYSLTFFCRCVRHLG